MLGRSKHKRSDVSVKALVERFAPRGRLWGSTIAPVFPLTGTTAYVKTHNPFSGACRRNLRSQSFMFEEVQKFLIRSSFLNYLRGKQSPTRPPHLPMEGSLCGPSGQYRVGVVKKLTRHLRARQALCYENMM